MNWCVGMLLCSYVMIFSCALGNPAALPKSVEAEDISRAVELSVSRNALWKRSAVCPGGQYYCPDSNTCCKHASGQYGCCPLPNAVCCSDGVHCCPNKYKCDPASGKCYMWFWTHVIMLAFILSVLMPYLDEKHPVWYTPIHVMRNHRLKHNIALGLVKKS